MSEHRDPLEDKKMEHIYRFFGAIWGGFLRFCSTFAWPLGIGGGIALGALLVVMYWGGAFTPTKTIEQVRQETVIKVSVNDREYLAAAIFRDALKAGEPIRVQEGVGWAVINFANRYNLDIPKVVSGAYTRIPLNYKRKKLYVFSLTYVKKWEATTGEWDAALKRADALIAKHKAALSDQSLACATHYVRKDRRTFSEPDDAIEQIVRDMNELPKGSGPNPGETRFFCPKVGQSNK